MHIVLLLANNVYGMQSAGENLALLDMPLHIHNKIFEYVFINDLFSAQSHKQDRVAESYYYKVQRNVEDIVSYDRARFSYAVKNKTSGIQETLLFYQFELHTHECPVIAAFSGNGKAIVAYNANDKQLTCKRLDPDDTTFTINAQQYDDVYQVAISDDAQWIACVDKVGVDLYNCSRNKWEINAIEGDVDYIGFNTAQTMFGYRVQNEEGNNVYSKVLENTHNSLRHYLYKKAVCKKPI